MRIQMCLQLVNQSKYQCRVEFIVACGNTEGKNYVALRIDAVFKHIEFVVQLVQIA